MVIDNSSSVVHMSSDFCWEMVRKDARQSLVNNISFDESCREVNTFLFRRAAVFLRPMMNSKFTFIVIFRPLWKTTHDSHMHVSGRSKNYRYSAKIDSPKYVDDFNFNIHYENIDADRAITE